MDQKYILEIYQLDVVTPEFRRIDIITTYKNLSYFNKLNGIGMAKFELALQDPKATLENLTRYRNHIAIKRYGTVVWFGPITDVNFEYSDVTGNISIDCNTYLYHLSETRFTDKLQQYTDTPSNIAWQLIDYTQSQDNGDLLIREGTLADSDERSETYEREEISQAIIGLSKVLGGIDFELVPQITTGGLVEQITFNTYYPYVGQVREDLQQFKIGQNVKSIKGRTSRGIFNAGTAEGSGTGSDVISSTLEYGASQQGYTRREIYQAFKGVSLPSTLSLLLETTLNNSSVEQYTIDIELYQGKNPEFGSYSIGDTLRVDIYLEDFPSSYINQFRNKQARLIELAVRVDVNGAETFSPKIELYN